METEACGRECLRGEKRELFFREYVFDILIAEGHTTPVIVGGGGKYTIVYG